MAKVRTNIPEDVASGVLFEQDHTCCVCREPGKHVQIHHIDEDPSNNSSRNLAVLCLEHHNDTQMSGGFGRKLSPATVTLYRDEWVETVRRRRQEADKIAVERMSGSRSFGRYSETGSHGKWERPPEIEFGAFIDHLPELRRAAYAKARSEWNEGGTSRVRRATAEVIDVLERVLVRLAAWYPPNHFDQRPAEVYFSEFIAERYIWHRALYDPDEPGSGGTVVHYHAGVGVLEDVSAAVIDMVEFHLVGEEFDQWKSRWEAAAQQSPRSFRERFKSAFEALTG
jgi:hypothetical protein